MALKRSCGFGGGVRVKATFPQVIGQLLIYFYLVII